MPGEQTHFVLYFRCCLSLVIPPQCHGNALILSSTKGHWLLSHSAGMVVWLKGRNKELFLGAPTPRSIGDVAQKQRSVSPLVFIRSFGHIWPQQSHSDEEQNNWHLSKLVQVWKLFETPSTITPLYLGMYNLLLLGWGGHTSSILQRMLQKEATQDHLWV